MICAYPVDVANSGILVVPAEMKTELPLQKQISRNTTVSADCFTQCLLLVYKGGTALTQQQKLRVKKKKARLTPGFRREKMV